MKSPLPKNMNPRISYRAVCIMCLYTTHLFITTTYHYTTAIKDKAGWTNLSSCLVFYLKWNMDDQIITTIAGIDIKWISDCKEEIENLRKLLYYHCISTHDETRHLHCVRYMPAWSRVQLPSDIQTKWNGYYVGCFHIKNYINWMYSPSTKEDYLILSDDIWIIHNREKSLTDCHLYCRKAKDGYVERPEISDTIIILLHTIMAMYNRYSIHAAAIEIEQKAHILIGESGHGKSTLCADLCGMGAGYIGDDIVFLYEKNGQPYIGSLLFNAKLFPNGLKKHKVHIDLIKKYGGNIILNTPIKGIYYICRTKHKLSEIKKLEPIELMVRLIRSSNNIRMQYDADVWQNVCNLIAHNIPYYVFLYGDRKHVSLNLLKDAN